MNKVKEKTNEDIFNQIESWMEGTYYRSGALRALCALKTMGFFTRDAYDLLYYSHQLGSLFRSNQR